MTTVIYKILPRVLWRKAEASGSFTGSAIDRADGFIHFSTEPQVRETAARHFAGQKDLVLAAVDSADLGDRLRWEVSRGGALFPHLYAPLDPARALWVKPLPLGADGRHDFSETLP